MSFVIYAGNLTSPFGEDADHVTAGHLKPIRRNSDGSRALDENFYEKPLYDASDEVLERILAGLRRP